MSGRERINDKALWLFLKSRCYGIINARSGAEIAKHFGAGDTKRVREAVNSLRRQEFLIGSCRSGYFVPANINEAKIAREFICEIFDPLRRAVDGYSRAMDREFGCQEQLPLEVAS